MGTRAEILDIYARYTHAFDEGDADQVAALFAEEGTFVREGSELAHGRYLDSFIREGDRWLIQERLFIPFSDSSPEFERQSGSQYPHTASHQ